MAKTTRRKTTESPDTTTIENDIANADVLDNEDNNITQDNDIADTDDITENHVDDEIQTDNTSVDVEHTETAEIENFANDLTTIEPKNTITVINNASRDFLEPATRTLLKSGEMTEIVLTLSKERIIGNLNQLNYLHGNCLVIGGDL